MNAIRPIELLAPAGDPESGYAALHYGADAIYLGLPRFSARAEAVNFSLEDLSEIVAYAHSLQPRRRVFVTVNTVLLQDELADAVNLLVSLADLEVDAVIVQDLGVARIIRRHVPELRMHASTQMAIHNLAGAEVLKELGFARVTLARELTLAEVRDITARCGIETETFIHGALCYSYSGLCLFSSMMRGRSGNRGRCAYPCRDFCRVEASDLKPGFPFSMKDLSLGDHVKALREAGVASFKIEGRKKSPLYVATGVNYYRRLLDGKLVGKDVKELEAQMKTVFSRPWTKLFIESPKHQDVVDRDLVGHRGVPVGTVETVYRPGAGANALRFTTARPIERHDGLQIDLPGVERPFGFAVNDLRVWEGGRARTGYEAPAGSRVEVLLPPDHPEIPVGATVYCSSSQAVKRSYPYERPKPGLFRVRRVMDVEVGVKTDVLSARAVIKARHSREADVTAEVEVRGTFALAKDAAKTGSAARTAFEKLGDTRLRLGDFACLNPARLFAPISMLNEMRRQLAVEVHGRLDQALVRRVDDVRQAVAAPVSDGVGEKDLDLKWTIKTDRIASLSTFEEADWENVREVIVDIARDPLSEIEVGLAMVVGSAGRERVRLALPQVTRGWEEGELRRRVEFLRKLGWAKWQGSNLSAWAFLGVNPALDFTVDWPVYVMNREAARAVLERGARGFALSPEDTRDNMRKLLSEFGEQADVIVYQDTPLFISASCSHANLAGQCQGRDACRVGSLLLKLDGGETVLAIHDNCRTVVVNDMPFCLADRLKDLREMGMRNARVDFIWQSYAPEEVRDLWRQIRSGRTPPRGHTANFTRGLM